LGKKVIDIVKLRKIAILCWLISIPLNFIGRLIYGFNIFFYLGIFFLFLFVVITLFFWKCPNCKERLPFQINFETEVYDYVRCPHCEIKVEDGEIIE